MSRVRHVGIAWVIICLCLCVGSDPSLAQSDDMHWSEPVNLSLSGAAESPVLVAGSRGQIQAFWWDRFDGIMTSYTTGRNRWSPAQIAPIRLIEVQDRGGQVEVITSTIESMPWIVGTGDMAHALWLGAAAEETEIRPLLYSQLRIGTAEWTAPVSLAESAAAWKMTSDAQGILHLVYCQTVQTETFPAGIYYRRSIDGGDTWSEPTLLYKSLYVRLWPMESFSFSIVADKQGHVLVSWDDPRQMRASYVRSADRGISWSAPREVADGDRVGQHPQFIVIPSLASNRGRPGVLLLWEEVSSAYTCALMQQLTVNGGRTWSPATRVFEDLTTCPTQIATVRTADETDSAQLLAVMGVGTERLLLAAWDKNQWSEVKPLTFSFENADTGATTYLNALQIAMTSGNAMVIAGQGQDGDIWTMTGETDAVEWIFAPPSPWSDVEIVAESETGYGFPTVVTDAEGNVHVMWAAALAVGQPDTALFYSRWDRTSWSRPVAVLEPDGGIVRSPSLALAGGFLHAVWSSGPTGTVFYSRVYPQDAYAASNWSTPRMLGSIDAGSTPAMTVDMLGRLHVVYAVPLNEGRGIYYTRTDDNGESWQEVAQVFDAATAHWPSVVHPDVTVDEQGTIHIVWVRAPLPGNGLPQGVYYARSTDRGTTWSEAVLMAEGIYDWPQIAATLDGQVVISWQDLNRDVAQYRISGDSGVTWGYVSQFPALQAIEGRAVLTGDATGKVHLMAIDTEADAGITLQHLILEESRWSRSDSIHFRDGYTYLSGAVPSIAEELGFVDVVGVGSVLRESTPVSVLWHTHRSIDKGIVRQPHFAPASTPTPTLGPTPTLSPTPRPTVIPNAPQSSEPVLELGPISLPVLALGGIGIALLLVSVAVVWKAIKR